MSLLWSFTRPLWSLISLGLMLISVFPGKGGDLDPNVPLSSYGIDVWDSSDGLTQLRIRALIQTRDGYIWLGTASGLVRFDGVHFTTFDLSTGSLKDNEISSLVEDADGTLWIGTYGGGLTRMKNGQFTTYTAQDGLADDSIRQMCQDSEGSLWIITPKGVVRLANGKFTVFTKDDGLPEDFVIAISPLAPQGIYATAGGKLSRFAGDRFEPVENIIEAVDGRVDSLMTGRNGELWLTFESGTIKCLKQSGVSVYTPTEHHKDRVGTMYEDPKGSVWFASRNSLLRQANGRFESIGVSEARLGLGVIISFMADAEGNLWVGSEANGLARLRSLPAKLLNEQDGLPISSTRSVFRDHLGDVWIGAYQGYARMHNDQITPFTKFSDGTPISTVTAMNEDAQGRLWLAISGNIFIRDQDQLQPLSNWEKVFDIKVIGRSREGHMWVGTDGKGLYEIAGDAIKVYDTGNGLANNQVRAIVQDATGAIWAGTSGGLSRITDGSITNFTTVQGLANNRVMGLMLDGEGVLWISTRAGLSRLKDGKFFNYLGAEGQPDSYIYNVLDDQRGGFWLSTAKGIFKVSRDNLNALAAGNMRRLEVTAMGYREGLRSAPLVAGTQPNATVDTDGHLLFCSLKGLIHLEPKAVSINHRPPPVYIEMLKINQLPRPVDQQVEIPPSRGDVEIYYTALSYVAPENVRFKYRLEGIDSGWVDAGTRRFAHYASLPPGNYKFHVRACNNDGIWNETGAVCSFSLQPYFYQKAWFVPALFGVVATAAGLLVWVRLRSLRQRARELQLRVDEAVARVKVLSGLLPICSGCRKIRDDKGYWNQIEQYIQEHADVAFSHGFCPDCLRKNFPELADEVLKEMEREKAAREKSDPPA